MRKISEMYKTTGGTDYKHLCGECCNLVKVRNGSRVVCKCLFYGKTEGHETDWKDTYIACRGFGVKPPLVPLVYQRKWKPISEEEKRNEIPGQMNIFDYPEIMPENEREIRT